jgi:hypothetical protein
MAFSEKVKTIFGGIDSDDLTAILAEAKPSQAKPSQAKPCSALLRDC